MSLFRTQSNFIITLDTGSAIPDVATNPKILYQKKGGTKGSWEATISGSYLQYTVGVDDIDVPGVWKFQAYYEMPGNRKAFGAIAQHEFFNPLN